MESKNKFWKGFLVGALVMAFSGLVIVGVSAGIFLIGKAVMDDPSQARLVEADVYPAQNCLCYSGDIVLETGIYT